jgi:hypothetical protein
VRGAVGQHCLQTVSQTVSADPAANDCIPRPGRHLLPSRTGSEIRAREIRASALRCTAVPRRLGRKAACASGAACRAPASESLWDGPLVSGAGGRPPATAALSRSGDPCAPPRTGDMCLRARDAHDRVDSKHLNNHTGSSQALLSGQTTLRMQPVGPRGRCFDAPEKPGDPPLARPANPVGHGLCGPGGCARRTRPRGLRRPGRRAAQKGSGKRPQRGAGHACRSARTGPKAANVPAGRDRRRRGERPGRGRPRSAG